LQLNLTRDLLQVRARLRGLYLKTGLLRTAAEVLLGLLLLFALDRTLDLPVAARLVLLFAFLGWVFLVRLRRSILYPMHRKVELDDVARAVERRFPEFDGALVSAVELERVADDPPQDVSRSLLEQWLGEIDEKARGCDFESIFKKRILRRLYAVNGALVVATLLLVGTRGDEVAIFLSRLTGARIDWPRATHLSLLIPSDNAHCRVDRDEDGVPIRVVVVRGGSLSVNVEVGGVVPDEVVLVVADQEGPGREEELPMIAREDNRRSFHYRFRNVLRRMTLRPSGGDDSGRGREVEVDLSPPPGVERILATVTPPAYTRLPQKVEERSDFPVPLGTALDLAIETFGETEEVSLTFHNDPGTARTLERDPEEGTRFHARVVVEESSTFNLHLKSRYGFRNLNAFDYNITALQDVKPTIDLIRPGVTHLEVTRRALVPFLVNVDDDFGLTAVELNLERMGAPEDRESIALLEVPADGVVVPPVGEALALFRTVDLLAFQLKKGEGKEIVAERETLLYRLRAVDNRELPNVGAAANENLSAERRIDVVEEGEKSRKLAERQLRLKQTVAKLHNDQKERLQSLVAFMEGREQDPADTQVRALASLEVEQNRIQNRARQTTKDFAEIVEEYLLNRLDPSPPAERVLASFVEDLKGGNAQLRFDPAPFQKLADRHKAGEFGQLEVLGNLLVMLDLALKASEILADKALEALREARITSDASMRPNLLESARDQEQKIVETYAELLRKMQEWEDFQEVIDLMRRLYRDQEKINDRYQTHDQKARNADR